MYNRQEQKEIQPLHFYKKAPTKHVKVANRKKRAICPAQSSVRHLTKQASDCRSTSPPDKGDKINLENTMRQDSEHDKDARTFSIV